MRLGRRLLHLAGAGIATQVLMTAAGLSGAAGLFLNLAIPLPVAYVTLVAGLATGAGAVALAAFGLVAAGSPAVVPPYLLQFGLGSLLLAGLLRRGWSWDRAIAVTVLAVFAVAAAALFGYAQFRGLSLQAMVEGYVHGEVGKALEMYRDDGLGPEMRAEFESVARRTGEFLARAYPGLALLALGFIQGITVLALKRLRRTRQLIAGGEFRHWRAPERLIWALILAGFGMVLLDGPGQRLALNLLTVLLPIYFLQGLAVVSYYFARKGVSPLLRGIGYVLIALLNPLPVIVTGIGVFDLWADFRKPRIKKS